MNGGVQGQGSRASRRSCRFESVGEMGSFGERKRGARGRRGEEMMAEREVRLEGMEREEEDGRRERVWWRVSERVSVRGGEKR